MEKRKACLTFNTWFPISLRVFAKIFRQNCYSALSFSNLSVWVRDRVSIVGIVTRLRAGYQIAGRVTGCLPHCVKTSYGTHPASSLVGIARGPLPGVNAVGAGTGI
jgi:hypothetical protein